MKTSEQRFRAYYKSEYNEGLRAYDIAKLAWESQEKTVLKLQEEVARLKEDWDNQHDLRFEAIIALNKANEDLNISLRLISEFRDLMHKRMVGFDHTDLGKDCGEFLIKFHKEERLHCAACGSWGDHRSGTCPTITKVRSDEKHTDVGTTDKIKELSDDPDWETMFHEMQTKYQKKLSDANDTIDQIGKQVYDLNLHMLEQDKILSYVLATHDFDSPESYRDEVMEKKIQEFLSVRSKEESK